MVGPLAGAPSEPACPTAQLRCDGACVDVTSDARNCGVCGRSCQGSELCDAGQCVSLTSTSCTATCGGGRLCVAGRCSCMDGQTACGAGCVDTSTSTQHCGGCDKACEAEEACVAGTCACPPGRMMCGAECADTQTSPAHCGSCDQACGTGEACTGGTCRGPVGADGCSGTARGVSIRDVLAYQSIEIPIVENAAAVATSSRVADLVQKRETLFAVSVDVDAGAQARELSARVTLKNGTSEDQFFAKQTIGQPSGDSDAANTFMVYAPAAKIQADTRYSVELVECSPTASGSAGMARFPITGEQALDARLVGGLKVRIIPVQVGMRLPDTSDDALESYRAYMMAIYPISELELEVGEPITVRAPVDWTAMLDALRARRLRDAAPDDVYYYGFIAPAASLDEYCRTSCTLGLGYLGSPNSGDMRVAVGIAFNDDQSVRVMAHELGHAHGREHSPCAPGGGLAGVDPRYPYRGALIGTWGYDQRSHKRLDPMSTTDIMGYCDVQWVSDYTYNALVERVATVNRSARVISAAPADTWRVMLLGDPGPRWGEPYPSPAPPDGEPVSAQILDASGAVIAETIVYRTAIGDSDAALALIPSPQPGWAAVRLPGTAALSF